MRFLLIVLLIFCLSVIYVQIKGYENSIVFGNEQIIGFHFHSYFFQNNPKSTLEAEALRDKIHNMIVDSYFKSCIVSQLFPDPVGAIHPLGNFITCCNSTSMWRALPWFMENHGNLSILLHPLTKKALSDHTERALFLGKVVPLDFTKQEVPNNLTSVFRCLHEDLPFQRKGVPDWV